MSMDPFDQWLERQRLPGLRPEEKEAGWRYARAARPPRPAAVWGAAATGVGGVLALVLLLSWQGEAPVPVPRPVPGPVLAPGAFEETADTSLVQIQEELDGWETEMIDAFPGPRDWIPAAQEVGGE